MTTAELAKKLKITQRAVIRRCETLEIPKTFIKGKWGYRLNYDHQEKIINMQPRTCGRINEIVEIIKVIRIETTYYIYPSKMNYLEIL